MLPRVILLLPYFSTALCFPTSIWDTLCPPLLQGGQAQRRKKKLVFFICSCYFLYVILKKAFGRNIGQLYFLHLHVLSLLSAILVSAHFPRSLSHLFLCLFGFFFMLCVLKRNIHLRLLRRQTTRLGSRALTPRRVALTHQSERQPGKMSQSV